MGRNALTPKEMAEFLQRYCGVKVRDWQSDEDWRKENTVFHQIIEQLEEAENEVLHSHKSKRNRQ